MHKPSQGGCPCFRAADSVKPYLPVSCRLTTPCSRNLSSMPVIGAGRENGPPIVGGSKWIRAGVSNPSDPAVWFCKRMEVPTVRCTFCIRRAGRCHQRNWPDLQWPVVRRVSLFLPGKNMPGTRQSYNEPDRLLIAAATLLEIDDVLERQFRVAEVGPIILGGRVEVLHPPFFHS